MTTVPGSRSWPSKRLSSSICCWWSNGLNSGDVASRFLSRRSRAKRSSALVQDRDLGAQSPDRRAIDLEQVGLADDLDRRRARLLGDERHLAEQRALVQARRARRPCCGRRARPRAPRRRDEVEGRAQLALPDHDLAVDGADQAQRLDRRRKHLARQLGEERHRQELLRVLDERRTGRRPDRAPGAATAPGSPAAIGWNRLDLHVEIDRRLTGRELRQRRGLVRVGRRHHGDDVVDLAAQRLRAPCSPRSPAAGGPSARRASRPRGRRRRPRRGRRARAAGRRSCAGCRCRAG